MKTVVATIGRVFTASRISIPAVIVQAWTGWPTLIGGLDEKMAQEILDQEGV